MKKKIKYKFSLEHRKTKKYYMKTVKDIIALCDWKKVSRALLYYYPEQKKALPRYKEIFEELKKKRIVKGRNLPPIEIRVFTDVLGPGSEDFPQYYHVSGLNPRSDMPDYAIGLTPWNQFLGFRVTEEAQKRFTREEIIAHLLWEITYYGFYEKEIQKVYREIVEA